MPNDNFPLPPEVRAVYEAMTTEEVARTVAVHNEQTKIRATLCNTIAAGFVVAGVITPIASTSVLEKPLTGTTIVLMILWFALAVGLHVGAIFTLERLK